MSEKYNMVYHVYKKGKKVTISIASSTCFDYNDNICSHCLTGTLQKEASVRALESCATRFLYAVWPSSANAIFAAFKLGNCSPHETQSEFGTGRGKGCRFFLTLDR